MESFYSIIYYKTNALTDELLSIGLLAGGGQGPFLFVSTARMELLKKSLHPRTFLSVNRHLKAIKEKIDKYRNETAGLLLFDPIFSNEQLTRLSKQTKSAILYSQPTAINEWLDAPFFEKLTKEFFGETVQRTFKRPTFHLKWKAFYHSKRFELWEKDVLVNQLNPDVLLSVTVDLVNTKENKMMKGIDFDLGKSSLEKKIYEAELMHTAIPDYQLTIVHPTPRKDLGKSPWA